MDQKMNGYKSILENSVHSYFIIIGTKNVTIDCQNWLWNFFWSREDVLEKKWARKD